MKKLISIFAILAITTISPVLADCANGSCSIQRKKKRIVKPAIKKSQPQVTQANPVKTITENLIRVPVQIVKEIFEPLNKSSDFNTECLRGLKINKDTTIIVWDLHDVLFERKTSKALNAVMRSKEKGSLMSKLIKYKTNKNNLKNICIEKYLEKEDGSLPDMALEAINCFEPNKEVIKIMNYLDKKGYTQSICSNIGIRSYNYLKSLYPEIFDFIKFARICRPENNWLTKATPAAFEELAQMAKDYIGEKPKYIIFFDNDMEKLRIANTIDNIIAIKFVDAATISGPIYRLFM